MEIRCISSMATRLVLAELVDAFRQRSNFSVSLDSVGGVDAAKKIRAGEAFDIVILASDAIEALIASGYVRAGTKVDLFRSGVAAAVRAGAPRPDIANEAALRHAVLGAQSISYSTGPSGLALARLFSRWKLTAQIQDRLILPPPGIPVGSLIARGEAELGFQQLSELMNIDGISVLGPLPPEIQIMTTFSAGLCALSTLAAEALWMLSFFASPEVDGVKRRQGMEPA